MDLMQVLKRCEVFVGLTDSDLRKVAGLPSWQRNTHNTGEFIFHENDVSKDFYILDEGEIRLVAIVSGNEAKSLTQVPVDTITKGDVFGWSSLVAPHSRSISAICVKPASVVAVDGAELSELMDCDHALGYEVMKGLVRVIGARFRNVCHTLGSGNRLPLLE